ncbi:MAG TPA: hypothetical protein VK524_31505 [Polyangiaceae bacterium]|nr:hypothetical protein [Polyangiaceae bacterium]
MTRPEAAPHQRDPAHWLLRFSPEEWLARSLRELERAEAALDQGNPPAAYAGFKRAAGMALNAALIALPNESWGRTYVEHVRAVSEQESAPSAVREAASLLLELKPSSGGIVQLRRRSQEQRMIEAARTVMAHAYVLAQRGTT